MKFGRFLLDQRIRLASLPQSDCMQKKDPRSVHSYLAERKDDIKTAEVATAFSREATYHNLINVCIIMCNKRLDI